MPSRYESMDPVVRSDTKCQNVHCLNERPSGRLRFVLIWMVDVRAHLDGRWLEAAIVQIKSNCRIPNHPDEAAAEKRCRRKVSILVNVFA